MQTERQNIGKRDYRRYEHMQKDQKEEIVGTRYINQKELRVLQ